MENDEDANQAIELLNEISLGKNGKPLVVKQAEDRPSKPKPNNRFNNRW
jgi:hypothetical protein